MDKLEEDRGVLVEKMISNIKEVTRRGYICYNFK